VNFENEGEFLLFAMHKFWEKGIGPNEFRKCKMKDIKNIQQIDNSINSRIEHEKKVQEMINNLKWK
jgi:hypothetical protein